MLWRQDTTYIYVLYNTGTWQGYDDTWTSSEPEWDGFYVPPAGLYQPKRGFGKVWREWLGGPEARIGWATAEERGGITLLQPLADGLLLKGVDDVTYVLYADGTWVSLP